MFSKRFTLTEAEALLPEVRRLLEELGQHKRKVDDLQQQGAAVNEKTGGNGHMHGNYETLEQQAEAAADAATAILRRINELGVQVKDIDTGLVDFPADYQGRTILLCWRLGEERIEWWHEAEAGFAGRQPLPEDLS